MGVQIFIHAHHCASGYAIGQADIACPCYIQLRDRVGRSDADIAGHTFEGDLITGLKEPKIIGRIILVKGPHL